MESEHSAAHKNKLWTKVDEHPDPSNDTTPKTPSYLQVTESQWMTITVEQHRQAVRYDESI